MSRVHFGLLGEGVGYSRSPEIFEALFDLSGLRGEFTTYNASPEELGSRVNQLLESGVDAVCITIPHKEMIIERLDEIDRTAAAIRSVNSVKFADGKSFGMNTDVYGFSAGLGEHMSALKGKRSLVLGAGGAARSAALGLALDCEIGAITLASRSEERRSRSARILSEALHRSDVSTCELISAPDGCVTLRGLSAGDAEFDVVVNATPLGGPNVRVKGAKSLIRAVTPTKLYYDLNYNVENELLCAAKSLGIPTLDGFPMLVHQALRSFELWTGVAVDYERAIDEIRRRS